MPRKRSNKLSGGHMGGKVKVVASAKGLTHWKDGYVKDLGLAAKKFAPIGRIEAGIEATVVEQLAGKLDVPVSAIQTLTRVSPSTYARRQKARRLSAEESDRVYRLQTAVERATDFFEGNADAARRWLSTPAAALGGARPLSLLGTEAGVREVESLLNRLEQGVFT